MSTEMTYLLRNGNIKRMISAAKSNPFPGVIGTFMGRDALTLAASYLDLDKEDIILLPAYLCREVLRPFLGRARILFYDVNPDLEADPDVIEKIVNNNKVKMMIIINYFGFLQPHRKQIKKICSERGIILIEDCAHSLLTVGSGDTGDMAIYSYRKIIPVPDGGGLKMNMNGQLASPKYYSRISSNILSVLIIIKAMLNVQSDVFSRAGYADTKEELNIAKHMKKGSRLLPMSSFCRNGLGHAAYSEIIEKRRADYQHWLDVSQTCNRVKPVFKDLPAEVCPLGFPVLLKDRDYLKVQMQKEGISLSVHWRLPEEVGNEHLNSRDLAARMLTLPIHFDLVHREQKCIERALAS